MLELPNVLITGIQREFLRLDCGLLRKIVLTNASSGLQMAPRFGPLDSQPCRQCSSFADYVKNSRKKAAAESEVKDCEVAHTHKIVCMRTPATLMLTVTFATLTEIGRLLKRDEASSRRLSAR